MLLVTEINHGLAYNRDVKVSFETFYEVISVAMVTKKPFLNIPLKRQFFKYISKINSVTYIFLKLFQKYAIFFTSCSNLKKFCSVEIKIKGKRPL